MGSIQDIIYLLHEFKESMDRSMDRMHTRFLDRIHQTFVANERIFREEFVTPSVAIASCDEVAMNIDVNRYS